MILNIIAIHHFTYITINSTCNRVHIYRDNRLIITNVINRFTEIVVYSLSIPIF